MNPVIVIRARENQGVAAGNNIALRYCLRRGDGAYFWLLNNDNVVEENALEELVKYFRTEVAERRRLECWARSCSIMISIGFMRWGCRYDRWFARGRHIGNGSAIRTGTISGELSSDYAVGASILVSKDFLQGCGPDERRIFSLF